MRRMYALVVTTGLKSVWKEDRQGQYRPVLTWGFRDNAGHARPGSGEVFEDGGRLRLCIAGAATALFCCGASHAAR